MDASTPGASAAAAATRPAAAGASPLLAEIVQRLDEAVGEVLSERGDAGMNKALRRNLLTTASMKVALGLRRLDALCEAASPLAWGVMSEAEAAREVAALEAELAEKGALLERVEADLRRWTAPRSKRRRREAR